MRPTDHVLTAALAAGGGALRREEHPGLRRTLDRRVRSGELVQLLPGVLVAGGHPAPLPVVAAAVRAWTPSWWWSGTASASPVRP